LLARLSALVLALALGFLVATLADSMVRGGLRLLPERLRWLRHSRRVLLEGLRTLVIASFALAAPFIPVALQILLLALVILQAVRYKNVTTMQQELHLRVQQLSQINRAAEALSSTLALDVLIETIC